MPPYFNLNSAVRYSTPLAKKKASLIGKETLKKKISNNE
jgi:hypothetical protein